MKFTDSTYCKNGNNCLNCRTSQGLRDSWRKRFEVPEDFDDRCPLGKTMEEINKGDYKPNIHPPHFPTLPELASNYAKAMTRKYWAKLKGENTTVKQEVFDERIRICRTNECGMRRVDINDNGSGGTYEVESCAECGCGFNRKLWLGTEKCPKGKWSAEV